MIEFNGALTGNAKEHFSKKMIKFIKYMEIVLFIMFIIGFSIMGSMLKKEIWRVLIDSCIFSVASVLLLYPLLKKRIKKMLPREIHIEDDLMIATSDVFQEVKMVDDVYEVNDYGEFYVITFTAENKSDNFICQKDLLSKGTLEEFEALFEGKIVRIQSN